MPGLTEDKPKPGSRVVLTRIPEGLLRGLSEEDQEAIARIVGVPILLNEYANGRAELEFIDADGVIHFIYVSLEFIKAA